ncbi:MAG: N-acetylmuramoyl-L-alanine amidase [Clostridia bacterium]|nr:N-acetylmuramoyl-L-alanine amidase [Clostridia bacterium]
MTKNTMSWIVVMLLVLIIILLSVCIYLDIEFTAAFTSSSVPNTTAGSTTTEPIINTIKPITTSQTLSTTKTPAPSSAPITTQTPNTTKVPKVTEAPTTTTQVPITSTSPVTTAQTPQSSKPTVQPDAPTICIDPGHGFTDPGACRVLNGVSYEEDLINLAIAFKLKDELIALGYNVIMTHDGDNLPANRYLNDSSTPFDVNGRNLFIRDHKDEIDLVVSIHCNTNTNTTITGTRFYILSTQMTGYTPKSVTLAEKLFDATHKALGTSPLPTNKYNTQELAVLKTGIPSVLVESAFMSNNSDLKKLIDPAWQATLAKCLAQGVKNYLAK